MAEETTPITPGSLSGVSDADLREALTGQPSVVEEKEPDPPVQSGKEVTSETLKGMLFRDGDGNVSLYNGQDARMDYDFDQFSDRRFLGVRTTKKLNQGSTFTGYSDTYNRSQEAQGIAGKLSNTVLGFVADTGINVAQGTVGMAYGAGAALANGDLTKIYDNTLSNALDRAQEGFNEQFEVTRGGNQGLLKKGVGLVDEFAGALSFVAGAVLTEVGLSAATALTGGAAAPVQAAATAGLVARGARVMKQLASGGRRFIGKTAVDDALKGATKLGDDATRATAAASLGQAGAAIDRATKLSSLARVSRQLLTGAGMEAGLEARHMLNEATEERSREFERQFGVPMTEEDKAKFREENSKYGDAVFGANLALVGVGNMLMFPKLFGLGMRRGMNVERFINKSSIVNPKQQQRIAKAYGKKWDDLPDILDVQRARRVAYSGDILNPLGGRMGRATARGRSALYEGFVEEGGQGTISRSTKDFIAQKYDPDNRDKVVKYTDSFVEGLQGAYGTAEGLKEVALGVVIGYMGLPNVLIGNVYSEGVDADGKKIKPRFIGGASEIRRQQLARDKQVDRILQLHKENGDVGAVMRAELDHAVRMQGLEKQHKEAATEGNLKVLKDIEGDSIFSFASSKLTTGRYDDAIAEFKGIVEEQTNEEFREMLAESDGVHVSNMTESEISDAKTRAVQRFEERMGMVKQAYEASESIYQGEDPEVHTALAHMLYNINDKDAREKSMAEELSKDLRNLTGAEVLDAVKVMTAFNVDEKTLNKAIKSQRRLQAIDKQLETKRAAGQISNVDQEKSTKRQEEIKALEEERERIMREREELEDALSGEYGFDLEKAQSRVDALFRLNEALIESGEEIGSFAKNNLDKDSVLNDLRMVALDRLALIRMYNNLLEPGGYDRFVASLSGGIQAQLKEDPVKVEEENEAKRAHEEAEEDVNNDEPSQQPPKAKPTSEDTPRDVEDPEDGPVSDIVEDDEDGPIDPESGDDTFIPIDDNVIDDEDGPVDPESGAEFEEGTAEEMRRKALEEIEAKKQQRTKSTEQGTVVFEMGSIVLDGIDIADIGKANPKRKGAAQAIVDNIGEGSTIVVRKVGGYVYYDYKDETIHSALVETVAPEIVSALLFGPLETSIVRADVQTGTRAITKDGKHLRITLGKGLTGTNNEANLDAIKKVVVELPASESGPGRVVDVLNNTVETATSRNARNTYGNATRTFVTVKDANNNTQSFDIRGQEIGAKVATSIIRMYELALVAGDFVTADSLGLTEAQYEAAWAKLSKDFGFDSIEDAASPKDKVESVLNQIIALKRKEVESNRPMLRYVKETGEHIPTLFITRFDDNGNPLKDLKYDPGVKGNAQEFAQQLSKVLYGIQFAQMDKSELPLSMNVNEDGSIDVEMVGKKEWYGQNVIFSDVKGRIPMVVNNEVYVKRLANATLETKTEIGIPAPKKEDDTIDANPENTGVSEEDIGNYEADDSDFSIVLDEDEEDMLKRAGDLYSVEGFTLKRVQDSVNVLAGKISQQLLAQSRSLGRRKPRDAKQIKGELKRNLTIYQKKQEKQVGNEIAQEKAAHVKKMLEPKNFDKFVELAFHEVLRQADGVIKVNSKNLVRSIEQIEDSQDLAREVGDKIDGEEGGATVNPETEEDRVQREPSALATFDDNFAFGTDPAKTMRFELRLMLMGLRHKESTPATQGILGRKFLDFKSLQAQIQPFFVGVEPSWEAVSKVMQDRADQVPVLGDILDQLDTKNAKDKDLDYRRMMRQQFVVWAHKEDGSHISIKLRPFKEGNIDLDIEDQPGIIYQFDSNESNMDKFVVRIALQNMLNREFFKLKGGETVVNRSTVQAIVDEMDRIADESTNKALDTTRLLYKHFGLQIPSEVLTDFNEDFFGIGLDMSNKIGIASSYGKLRLALKDYLEQSSDIEATEWYSTKETQQAIQNFFGSAAKHQQNLIQMVSRDADGKLRYHYHAPKHLTVQLRNLRENDLSSFDEGNPLVKAIRRPDLQQAKHKVRVDYVNGIKNLKSAADSRTFHDMEEPDQIIARMSFMGNDNDYDNKGRPLSRHMLPTLADKSTMPLLRVPAMNLAILKKADKFTNIPTSDIQVTDLLDVDRYYKEQLLFAVNKELDMIQEQRVQGDMSAKFILFPMLNSLLPEGQITKGKRAALHSAAPNRMAAQLQDDFQYVLNQLANEAYDKKRNGAIGKLKYFDKAESNFVITHIGEQNKNQDRKTAFLLYAAKYVAESRAINAQSLLAFTGSPEAFLKYTDGVVDSGRTIDNLGKRLAGLIAPGTAIPIMSDEEMPNGRSNSSISVLVLKDKKHNSEHLDYLRKIGVPESEIKSQYKNIDAADAAEYVTAEEHLGILLAQGKMSLDEYNGIMPKVKSGAKLDVDELSWFQPMKPVNVMRDGAGIMHYVKSAQFPLLPRFTKGTQLDKLRKLMEENNIDRAIHKTAYKVGSHKIPGINIYTEDGKIEIPEDIRAGQSVLDRRGMRIQQEVPVGKSKEKIHGSQVAKLVMANIAREEYTGFEVNGVSMNGKQVHEHYIAARKEERMLRREMFAKRYGFKLDKSVDRPRLQYAEGVKPKLAERLLQEAMERGYEIAEIAHLRLDLKKNRFRTPLWASISEERVNSLLQSIYRKEVIESRIAGFSGPIAPAMGMAFDDITDMDKSGIVWVGNKFDGKKLRVGIQGKPDQILMPWKFKGNLSKFIDPETKRLDMDKVPEELLQVFAYRIPNQKKASSGSFEIVGFLPDSMGDTLIVPDELVGRIGQDFDIDKMFGMMYSHRLDPDTGKITIIREAEIENKGTINIYYGQNESETNTRILSNLAERRFTYEGREYGSVEHAYQSNKSGTFDQTTYDKYKAIGGFGKKIRGPQVTEDFDNLELMRELVLESFVQNPESQAAQKLLQYDNFTHNSKQVIDSAFLEGLYTAKDVLRPTSSRRLAAARNRQIDVYHASMRNANEEVQKEIHTPISNGYSKALARHLATVNPRMDPLSVRHNVRTAIGASSAKSAIGVFANANTLHSQLEMAGALAHYQKTTVIKNKVKTVSQIVRIADTAEQSAPDDIKLARLGDREILDTNFILEYPKGTEAGTVQDQFSRLLNHAVDNANDQLLERLGIDKYTYPFWVHMTNMGYNMETIAIMVRQPEVVETIEEQRRFAAVSNNEYFNITDYLDKKIKIAEEEYLAQYGEKPQKRTMAKNVLAHRSGIKLLDEVDAQTEALHSVNVYRALQTLTEVERGYQTLMTTMKMDTASPKNRGEFFYKMEKARQFRQYHIDRQNPGYEGPRYSISFSPYMHSTGGPMDLDAFINNSVSGLAFQDAQDTSADILQLEGEHLEGTPFGRSIIEASGRISKEFQTDYYKGVRSYLAARWVEQRTGKDARVLRRELTQNQGTSIARKVTDALQNNPEIRNNLFLKHLEAFDLVPNKDKLHTVEFQGDRSINVSPEQLHSAFLSMARSKNPEVKKLAYDLVEYDLVMRGTLGSKSFGKYIPAEMLQSMGIQDIYDPNQKIFQLPFQVNTAMHKQIMQHNPKIAPVVDVEYPPNYRHIVDEVQFKGGPTKNAIGYVRDTKGRLYQITKMLDDGIVIAKGVAVPKSSYLHNYYATSELTNAHEFSKFYKDQKVEPVEQEEVPSGENEERRVQPEPIVSEEEAVPGEEEVKVEAVPTGIVTLEEAVSRLGGENNLLLQQLVAMNNRLDEANQVSVIFNETGDHKYSKGIITLNATQATPDRLAHEMVHHMSRIGANLKENAANRAKLKELYTQITTDEALTKRFGYTPAEVKKLKLGFETLRKVRLGEMEMTDDTDPRVMLAYSYFQTELRNDKGIYGLVNVEEFIAEAMTNAEFAAVLNEIRLSPNKTLLERIYEVLADIITTLNTQILGDPIEFSKDSALAAVNAASYSMMETTAENLSNIKENGAGSQMTLFSFTMPEGIEAEELKATDLEVLKQYKKRRIAEFEELKARFENSPKVVADVDRRLRMERMELMALEGKDDDSVRATVMVEMAQRELEDVNEVVRNVRKATTRDTRHAYAHARLQNAQAVIDFYSKGRKLLDTEGMTRSEVGRLQGVASQLQDDWLDVSAEILQNYARERYRGTPLEELVTKNTFRDMKDIGALNSLFMDASRVGRVELSYLDDVVRKSAQAQRAEWVARNEEFNEKSEAFKDTEYYKKYSWSGLVKGTEENQTNELIGPISAQWDMELKKRRAEAFRTKNFRPFQDWLKENSATVNMRAYDLTADTVVRKPDPKIELELEKQLGKAATKELFLRQDRLVQRYIDSREAAFDMIEAAEPKSKHAALKAQWINKNGFGNPNTEFLYRMPVRFIKGKETQWHDSRYIELQREPAALAFYEMYREQMRDLTASLPRHEMSARQIALMEQGLFIPAVKQSLIEQFWKSDNRRQDLNDALWSSITTKIDDSLAKSIDPVTGEVRRNLPTYFLNELKNKASMEYDLEKNFAAFSMMATSYKHKNLIEDEVRMIEAVLGEVGIQHSNSMGQKILSAAGAVMSSNTQSARSNVNRSVKAIMDSFYGRRSNLEGKMLFGAKKARTAEEKEAKLRIENSLKQLEEDRKVGAIPKTLYDVQKAELEEELKNVGSQYDFAKIIRRFVQYMQMKGMAWNLPAAQVNAVFGTMQVMKHAAGQKDFNEKEARQAFGIMMHSTLNLMTLNTGATKTATGSKLQGLMTTLNMLKDFTEIEFDPAQADVIGNKRKGLSKAIRMYEIQRSSEYFTYGHVMVSYLLNQKVDGKSLFELADENGIIQAEGYRPGEAKFVELANRLDQINKRIHGNYDPQSIMPIKQTLIGPMLMQFRSWLPEGFATRYEAEKFDPLLNRQVKGSIRTVILEGSFKSKIRKVTESTISALPIVGNKIDLSKYSEVDEENIRKFGASMRQMMWMYLLVMALRSMKDDEDDEDVRHLLNYGLNLSSRIENDLKFFGNVGSQRRIMQDVLPILKIAEDVEKFGDAVVDTMMGEGTVPTGVYAGESKLWLHGSKLVPHTEAPMRVIRNLRQEM